MDSKMQEVLDHYARFGAIPIEKMTPENARQLPELKDAILSVINEHASKRLVTSVIEHVDKVDHILIPGPQTPLLTRLYHPKGNGPHPVLLYFHGGGFVFANLNTYDASCRALCNATDCIVASVSYRQAPEHKYPAARRDAITAYEWLSKNAESIGGDPTRIAVAGESAGGNLAALVCLLAREKNIPQPVHQLLIYPFVDTDMNTQSYRENAEAKPLNRAMMKWFSSQYLRDPKDKLDWKAFPLLVDDMIGLSSATVITAEIDPLCSEGEAYALKLQSSGVSVVYKCFEGVTHEFFGMGAVVPAAKEAVKLAAEQLQTAFFGTQDITKSLKTEALGQHLDRPHI